MNHDLASTYLSCLMERKDHSPYRPVFRHVALFAVSRKPSFFMPTCYSLCPKWLSASFYISWFWDKICLLLQNLHPTFPLIRTPAVECSVPSVHFPFPVAALLFLLRLAVAPQPLSHSIRAASFHHSRVSMQVWPTGYPGMTPNPFLFHYSLFYTRRTQRRIMSLSPLDPQASTNNFSLDSPKICFSTVLSLKLPIQHFLASALSDWG